MTMDGSSAQIAGNQSLLKRINRMALVRLVKAEPGLSRVELAKRTGLTKTTVGQLVQELIQEGWLCQIAPSPGQGAGRRPLPLVLDPSRVGLLGAELGVDYLNVVGCNLQGAILFSRMVNYQHRDVARTVRSLSELVAEAHSALAAQKRRTLGLGVGLPGTVDLLGESLRFAPNIGWRDLPIRKLIETGLRKAGCGGLRASVLNEANAAVLSEYVFGAEHQSGPLVYLSMGIGLGAGIVLRDRLYLGQDGLAGEVGHNILEKGGPQCSCGRRGCAETFISQRAISELATGRENPILSIDELVARVEAKDHGTVRAVARAGEYLGVLIENLGNTLNPGAIVLGGPLCRLGEAFVRPAFRAMHENAGRYQEQTASIRTCRFGVNACAVGAAGSVFQGFLQSLSASDALSAPRGREE
jgi:predicted NBD/HSP70 family sugar kinase/DNA-binding XRE family transcriptional regulator